MTHITYHCPCVTNLLTYHILCTHVCATQVLREGQEAADEVADRTLVNAKRAMGFTLPGDKKLPKL